MLHHEKHSSTLLAGGSCAVLAVLLAGCMLFQGEKTGPVSYQGPPASIGQGAGRSFVALDGDGRPTALGIRLSAAALRGLPEEDPADAHGWEYLLELPPEAAGMGYDHIGINWNPHGHIPQGVYDKPHFDVHFYLIDTAARSSITAVGDDLERAHKAPAEALMPAGYILPPGTEVPGMGAHAINPGSDEFIGKPFTKTFIYGFYDGALIFVEPMMTKDFLEARPNDHVPVPVPATYARPGYYPAQYGVWYDESRGEYVIALENLALR